MEYDVDLVFQDLIIPMQNATCLLTKHSVASGGIAQLKCTTSIECFKKTKPSSQTVVDAEIMLNNVTSSIARQEIICDTHQRSFLGVQLCEDAATIECNREDDRTNDKENVKPPLHIYSVSSTVTDGKRRLRDKKYFCFYCSLLVAQLPRHLYSCHNEEFEVVEARTTKDSKRKRSLLNNLRNMGNYKHNMAVNKEGSGNTAVVYRPSKELSVDESMYVPCEYCYGFYRREQLWRHRKRCLSKGEPIAEKGKGKSGGHLKASDLMMNSVHNDEVAYVIAGMRKAAVYSVIKNDELIREVLRKLMSRTGHNVHHVNYVRNRLRNLGRLILQIRKNHSSLKHTTLSGIISPRHIKTVVNAVKVLAGYDTTTHSYACPSVGVQLGHDLSLCAATLKSMSVMNGDLATASSAKLFGEEIEAQWNFEVSGNARRNLQTRAMNNPKLLPVTSDVVKFTSYLKEMQAEAMDEVLRKKFDSHYCHAFKSLSEATLALVILFNRRRQGEVSKLTVERYCVNSKKQSIYPEIEECISPLEKKLCHLYTRIEIPGKRNRCVPILLIGEQKEAMDCLSSQQMRHEAGISDENE
jgi:hypothetical protein